MASQGGPQSGDHADGLNPYASPPVVASAPPEDVHPLEAFFRKNRRRWLEVRRMALGGALGGPLLAILYGYQIWETWQRSATVEWLPASIVLLSLVGLVAGIGLLLFQPWARWVAAAAVVASILVGFVWWCGRIQIIVVLFKIRAFADLFLELLWPVVLISAFYPLYVLVTEPTERFLTPEFREFLREMRQAGKGRQLKWRTSYWGILLLLVILVGMFLAIARL